MFLIITVYIHVLSLLVLQVRNKNMICFQTVESVVGSIVNSIFFCNFLGFWCVKCLLRGYQVIHSLCFN